MFCDIVDSTALSERLDPEEFRELIRTYQHVCDEVIHRFDGYIAQYLGDGLLVYFGYPQAHEDDAQRAVRAGLEIAEAIPEVALPGIPVPGPPPMRIGIHTGLVVIGGIGTPTRSEKLALGETPNVAARLQGLAAPNTVVLSAATARLVQGYFAFGELGAQQLKGLSHPLLVYQALRESGLRSRLQVARLAGLTPLVGREPEEQLLLQRWRQAKAGAGQVVLVNGEAGIGKSRLVHALIEHLAAEPYARLDLRCSSYYQHSALYPVGDLLQRACGLKREDASNVKLEKLEAALASYRISLEEIVPLFASLLSLSLEKTRFSLPTLTPQQQKQKTLEASLAVLLAVAEQQPLLIVVEDLHWIDPSTLELLNLLFARTPASRILVVATFRPDFSPPWREHSHLTVISLTRLEQRNVEEMIRQVTRGKTLPPEVFQQIVTTTDGVPLFVEELTKMVLESELVKEQADFSSPAGPLPPLAIPATLYDSLMARLDRLSTAKEVAQLGAVIGREFTYEALRAVSSLEEDILQRELLRLVEAELLYQSGAPPQAIYMFKHALIREAAYQSLLKSARQQHHRNIAQTFVEQFPEVRSLHPEILAHHYTEAALLEEAVLYWQHAGQRAVERSANEEAITHFSRALALVETLPDTRDRCQQELALHIALGAPLLMARGYKTAEVVQTYTRAWELCRQIGKSPQVMPVLAGLFRYYFACAELDVAQALGEQTLRLAERGSDSFLFLAAHVMVGSVLCTRGEFPAAREHFERGAALYTAQPDPSAVFLYGDDPGMLCLTQLGTVLWFLGYPEQALQKTQHAFALAQKLEIPYILAGAWGSASQLHSYRREGQAALKSAEELLTLALKHGFQYWTVEGQVLKGLALALQNQEEERWFARDNLLERDETTAMMGRARLTCAIAETCGNRGQPHEGLRLLDEELALVRRDGTCMHEAELYRIKGELLLQLV